MRRSVVLSLICLAVSTVALAQERADFTFNERVRAGAWLRVHTTHGDIHVIEGSGDRAEVIGRKDGEDAADLQITAVRTGDDVTICAVFEGAQCDAEGIHSSRRKAAMTAGGQRRLRGAAAARREDPRAVGQRRRLGERGDSRSLRGVGKRRRQRRVDAVVPSAPRQATARSTSAKPAAK